MTDHPTITLANQIDQELRRDAKPLADALFPGGPGPDHQELSQRKFEQYVADSWFRGLPMAQPPVSPEDFRKDLLTRMGPEQFMALAKAVVPQAQQAEAERQQALAHAQQQAQMAQMQQPPATGMPPMPSVPPPSPPPLPVVSQGPMSPGPGGMP